MAGAILRTSRIKSGERRDPNKPLPAEGPPLEASPEGPPELPPEGKNKLFGLILHSLSLNDLPVFHQVLIAKQVIFKFVLVY